jgi:alpha-L-fucosidase
MDDRNVALTSDTRAEWFSALKYALFSPPKTQQMRQRAMSALKSLTDYEAQIAATRDTRMQWWKDARYGMFIHYGVHTVLGRNEWAMAIENWEIPAYEKLATQFAPQPGCTRKWARLAKEAGMKYMVLTTRHHEGFSLWNSKTNPYNTVNCCPGGLDVVKEYVESCREFGLGIGFYFSLMDWHHPDSWRCAFDPEARARFLAYLQGMLRELLGGDYGKIDILWYDVSRPMESPEGWGSLQMNQMVRELQPDIMINNRSQLPEDFATPEESLAAAEDGRGWESCMTFNRISWGHLDSAQAAPYSYNAQGILRMLHTVCNKGGNLLLNIGPTIEGDVPAEAIQPLQTVGKWLAAHGEAVYGALDRCDISVASGTGALTQRGNKLYFWQWIWSDALILGGFHTRLKAIRTVPGGESVGFTQTDRQIVVDPRPETLRDPIANVTVLELEFEDAPEHHRCVAYPQLHGGKDWLAE